MYLCEGMDTPCTCLQRPEEDAGSRQYLLAFYPPGGKGGDDGACWFLQVLCLHLSPSVAWELKPPSNLELFGCRYFLIFSPVRIFPSGKDLYSNFHLRELNVFQQNEHLKSPLTILIALQVGQGHIDSRWISDPRGLQEPLCYWAQEIQ